MGTRLAFRNRFRYQSPSSMSYITNIAQPSGPFYAQEHQPYYGTAAAPPSSSGPPPYSYDQYPDSTDPDSSDERITLQKTKETWFRYNPSENTAGIKPTRYPRIPYILAFCNLYDSLTSARAATSSFHETFKSETAAIRTYAPRTLLRSLWRFRGVTQSEVDAMRKDDVSRKCHARRAWMEMFDDSLLFCGMPFVADPGEEIERRAGAARGEWTMECENGGLCGSLVGAEWALALAACALPVAEMKEEDFVIGEEKVMEPRGEGEKPRFRDGEKMVVGKKKGDKAGEKEDENITEQDELLKEVLNQLLEEWPRFSACSFWAQQGEEGIFGVQEAMREYLNTLESVEHLWMEKYRDGKWKGKMEMIGKPWEEPLSKGKKGKEKAVHWT